MSQALYVYGIVSRDESDAIASSGVEGAEVATVDCDGLAALTSPVDGDALAAAREIRAHWHVLQAATESATVLPVRFGTVLESAQAVREQLLEPNLEQLGTLLEELRGTVQLSVKGRWDEDRTIAEVVKDSPRLAALARRIRGVPEDAGYYERIQLGEEIAAALDARRAAEAQAALAALEPCAVASRTEQITSPDEAFNLAFLVRRSRQGEFSQRVTDLIERAGDLLEIRYVGPLPPYSFAEAELSTGSEQWG